METRVEKQMNIYLISVEYILIRPLMYTLMNIPKEAS